MNLWFQAKPDSNLKSRFMKILCIMKLTIILLFGFLLHANANNHAQTVTLVKKNIPLIKVLDVFQKQTGYHFLYTHETIGKAGNIDANFTNESLVNALGECLNGKSLSFSIMEKTVVIKPAFTNASKIILPEDIAITVSGMVTDAEDKPIEGVSVLVKGTSKGTTTNSVGRYSLTGVDENAILVFSAIGYTTQEVQVKNKKQINVKLVQFATVQDEVVLASTGYQAISKERATGSYDLVLKDQLENYNSPQHPVVQPMSEHCCQPLLQMKCNR